jgi:hypothetical protein
MFIVGDAGDAVYEYSVGTIQTYSTDYGIAVTSAGGQIDSEFWTTLNSLVTTEVLNSGNTYYAYSTDGRTTWSAALSGSGERPIARNNAGTWEYNSSATFGLTTWTPAATNDEFSALQEALGVAANRISSSQFDASANEITLGNSLDLMIGFKVANANDISPTSDGTVINYDANILNQGAIVGTDYDWDFPDSTTVRITSLGNYNFRVRVV